MKTPDPDHPMKYSPPDTPAAESTRHTDATHAFDPLDALLAEEIELETEQGGLDNEESLNQDESASLDTDDERLYTNEFIRANENASRSLFLGFLGLALFATSLVAWLSLSSSDQEEPPEELPSPVSVPSAPPNEIPDQRLDSIPTVPLEPETGSPANEPTQPSLVFPAQPNQPPSQESQTITPVTPENAQEPTDVAPLPEGSVPPPPPVSP